MKFITKEEAELWKAVIKIRAASNDNTGNDIAVADKMVTAFRERKQG